MFNSLSRKLLSRTAPLILPYLPYQLCSLGLSGKFIIEPTNRCNFKCPLCPTAHNMLHEKEVLELDAFKNFVMALNQLEY